MLLRVFEGLIEAMDRKLYPRTSPCPGGYGVMGDRVDFLRLHVSVPDRVQLGRYKMHNLDVSIIRNNPRLREDTWENRANCTRFLNR